MTSDHADKMEITVVFQCPPKGRELLANALATARKSPRPLGRVGEGLSEGWGGAYSHKKTGEPTVKVGIPG